MNETQDQQIERLKKNKETFGLLCPDDQKFLRTTIGKKNCEIYFSKGVWLTAEPSKDFVDARAYRIRPDYQSEPPKPEYIDLLIEKIGDWLGVHAAGLVHLPYPFTHLHCLSSLPDFRGFWLIQKSENGNEYNIHLDYIAHNLADGLTVVARFERK